MILTYHSITPRVSEPNLQVHPTNLHRQIDALLQSGWMHRPLLDLEKLFRAECRESRKCFSLTFDDAYVDFADHALPVLEKLGIDEVTMFACPGLSGRINDWSCFRSLKLRHMTADELIDVKHRGVRIEPHGWTHGRFTLLSPKNLFLQLDGCMSWFRENLNVDPRTIAYPYGDFDSQTVSVVSEFFATAYSVEQGMGLGSHYAIPRFMVANHTQIETFVRWSNRMENERYNLFVTCMLEEKGRRISGEN